MKNFRCKLLSPILALFLAFTVCAAPTVRGSNSPADVLSALGLLKGQDGGLALELRPTRAEAVTMAVRLSGQELESMLSAPVQASKTCRPAIGRFPM